MARSRAPKSDDGTRRAAWHLRREPTSAEALLWERLRDRRCTGLKFRRQHPIGPFIVDFVCLEGWLVVEVDGSVHAEEEQTEKDQSRSEILAELGYQVIRFTNDEVESDMECVLASLRDALAL